MSVRPSASEDFEARHRRAMRHSDDLAQLVAEAYGLGVDAVDVYDDADDAYGVQRDLEGIDAVIHTPPANTATISFRTRPQDEQYTDLPIRATSRSGAPSEWYRWQGARNPDCDVDCEVPDVIVYALIDDEIDECWIIDTSSLLSVVFDQPDKYDHRMSTTKDGEIEGSAVYIPASDYERTTMRYIGQ